MLQHQHLLQLLAAQHTFPEMHLAAIETAINGLNEAWQNASQEMYAAQQEAGAGADAGAGAGAEGAANAGGDSDSDVSDVEYEEVDDKK